MKHLLGKAQDPAFWQLVREDEAFAQDRAQLLLFWEEIKDIEMPPLTYAAYRRFHYDGDRDTYEKPYFFRRRALNTAALLAMIYPECQAYMVKLMDIIYAICDEYTWCLPAHQTELGVNNNRHIDLFAAETGMCLAEIYTILGEEFEPLISDRIRVEINRRIIASFLDTRFFWEKNGSNWAAVCTGSVACTFMLMAPHLVNSLEERFATAMTYYLGGFAQDGVCEEGFAYWCYGFGFFTVWADMVRTFTEGRVNWFENPKVKAVAPFLSRMYLTEGCTVSFSDAGQTGKYSRGILHYLKAEYPTAVTIPDEAYAETMDACGRWCTFLRNFTWYDTTYQQTTATVEDMLYYAPSVQWLIKRGESYSFAAKGGHNCEPHNHHDVGSFIIAKNGRQILTDPGSGVYTRQYFTSAVRYDGVACGSFGHSVPYFGTSADREAYGKHYGYQKDGKQYRAEDVKFEDGRMTMDIAGAYGEAFVHHVWREFTLTDDAVILYDKFDVDAGIPITERMVSFTPYQCEAGQVTTEGITIRFDAERCDVACSVGDFKPDVPVYFLDLRLHEGVREIQIQMILD